MSTEDARPTPNISAADEARFQRETLVSVAIPAPGITAAAFLHQGRGSARFYWQDGRSNITFAGFGTAANLFAWGDKRFRSIRQQATDLFDGAVLLDDAPPLARPRLFGGFAFRDDFTPDNTWAVYHPAHFILPHFQLVRIDNNCWLTINALIPHEEDPGALREALTGALEARLEQLQAVELPPSRVTAVTPTVVNYPLSFPTWKNGIERAQQMMAAGELRKVVLARAAELRFDRTIDVDAALAFLKEQYGGTFRFLFEPRPDHAFIGAAPELLARVEGATLRTMGLAGSIRRSADSREDAALGQELLNSAKDRHEHEVVNVAIMSRLAPLTSRLEISPQPGVYKLHNIQHLLTPIRATLARPEGILPIVQLLHPTPALGGEPRDRALALISEVEPVPRGWYAGPVGWIDHKLDGTFAVAIRSAVTEPRRAWLYAGSGIVADSDPRREWDETALKFVPMLEALGVDPTTV